MNYEIITESNLDLPKKIREEYGLYHDYIHNVVYLPSKEIEADLDFENFTPKLYFALIKKNAGRIKTAFATYEEFKRVVEPVVKSGKDAIIPVISSAISGTYNAFRGYAEEILKNYKGRKIIIFDTLRYGSAGGLNLIYLGINKKNGMSLEENLKWVTEHRDMVHQIGPMDDLRFLSKNGRLSATKAFFGSLVGVMPIADFTIDGVTSPLGTVKGEDMALKVSLEYLLKTVKDIENQVIVISHSDRLERANKMKEMLLKVAKPKEVHIMSVGQSCGPNIGPGLCAYFYLGEKHSIDRSKEVEIFNELTKK